MKKTLIALMALAGVSFGADYTTELEWTASFGSSYTNGYETDLTKPGTFWDAGDVKIAEGALTTDSKRIHMADGAYGDWATDFQYTMNITLDNLTTGHITELKASSTNTWLCIGIDTNGVLTLTGVATGTSADSIIAADTAYAISFTKLGTNVTLAVNGKDVITTTIGSVSGTIDNIALGGNTGSDKRVPTLIESISWSSVSSVITPDTPAAPEPTTATLSLLALAGLAARRRRR